MPTATDIAFALGVLALVGSRVPASLKVFLTSLAIIDDLGAILIIATFYASDLSFVALAVAAVFAATLYWLNRRGETRLLPYILLGVMLWAAMLFSGIHATLAGVILAMMIPINHASDGKTLAAAQHGAGAVALGRLSRSADLRLRQCRRVDRLDRAYVAASRRSGSASSAGCFSASRSAYLAAVYLAKQARRRERFRPEPVGGRSTASRRSAASASP